MSNNDHEAIYEYLCRTCGHHERKHAGYPLACVVCDSHNLLRTPLFREPKPGEYDIWARDQHIEVLKAEVERLRADVARLEGERDRRTRLLEVLRWEAKRWATHLELTARFPGAHKWIETVAKRIGDLGIEPVMYVPLIAALGEEEPTDAD